MPSGSRPFARTAACESMSTPASDGESGIASGSASDWLVGTMPNTASTEACWKQSFMPAEGGEVDPRIELRHAEHHRADAGRARGMPRITLVNVCPSTRDSAAAPVGGGV